MSVDLSKSRLSQLSSVLQDLDSRVARSGGFRAESVSSLQNQLTALEVALREEISRRSDVERRVTEAVDGKVRVAMDRLADAVEGEMTRLYRKMDGELNGRLDGFARELASSLSTRLPQLEAGVSSALEGQRRINDSIARLEGRIRSVEDRITELPRADSLFETARMQSREDLTKARSSIDNDMRDLRDVLLSVQATTSELGARIEVESREIKAIIEAETQAREDSDKDLVDVVTQYANVIAKLQRAQN